MKQKISTAAGAAVPRNRSKTNILPAESHYRAGIPEKPCLNVKAQC